MKPIKMTLAELEVLERLKWYRLNMITHNLSQYTTEEKRQAAREYTLARRALENYSNTPR